MAKLCMSNVFVKLYTSITSCLGSILVDPFQALMEALRSFIAPRDSNKLISSNTFTSRFSCRLNFSSESKSDKKLRKVMAIPGDPNRPTEVADNKGNQ